MPELVALGVGGGPEREDVHAAIGLLRRDVGRPHDVAGGPVPGQAEFAGSGLDRGDDLVGDLLMDVKALFFHRFSPPWARLQLLLQPCPSARPGRGGGKRNRCGWCGRTTPAQAGGGATAVSISLAGREGQRPSPSPQCGRQASKEMRQGWKPKAETARGFGSRQPGAKRDALMILE